MEQRASFDKPMILTIGIVLIVSVLGAIALMSSESFMAAQVAMFEAMAAGVDWQISAWRGLAGPAGMPEDVTQTLTAAFEKVWNSAEFQDFMKGRGFGLEWRPGGEFAAWMEESDASLGEVMQAVGLAQ